MSKVLTLRLTLSLTLRLVLSLLFSQIAVAIAVPKSIQLNDQAYKLESLGQFMDALALYEEALQAAPNGYILPQIGLCDVAIKLFESTHDLDYLKRCKQVICNTFNNLIDVDEDDDYFALMTNMYLIYELGGNRLGQHCYGSRGIDVIAKRLHTVGHVELPILHFEFDSYHLSADMQALLENLVRAIGKRTCYKVVGSTDRIGTVTYNRILGLNRAKSVAQVIGGANTMIASTGEDEPLPCDQDRPSCRALNRRVVLYQQGCKNSSNSKNK